MKYIVAGSERQYYDWLRISGYSRRETRYVRSVEDITGRRMEREDVVFWGTFNLRDDIEEINKRVDLEIALKGE